MRARTLRLRSDLVRGTWPGRSVPRRPSPAALGFLRGRDADGRLRELIRERARARPCLAALAEAAVRTRAHEALGFRSLGDWSRERIGVCARAVGEWARVWRRLRELPRLRASVYGRRGGRAGRRGSRPRADRVLAAPRHGLDEYVVEGSISRPGRRAGS